MKNTKQFLYAVMGTAFMTVPLITSAQGFSLPAPTGLTNKPIFQLLTTFMNWLLGIIGVLGVIAFVISGILYLTSAGDADQTEKAKGIMMYAIIGLVVALVGLIIVNAVAGLTGAGGSTIY